nr:unnamed protein product [Callosobruchus chinensis]
MKLLGRVDIRQQLDSAYRRSIQQQNEQVRKNRYVLSKIINCIKFCGAFELALRGHDESKDSSNPGIFRSLINFSSELDTALKDHFEKPVVSKVYQKLFKMSCGIACWQLLKNILRKKFPAPNMSLLLLMKLHMSLSDDCNGTPVERFWCFTNPPNHDAVSLSECIKTILKQVIDKPEKLISQSYDGASVMSGCHSMIINCLLCTLLCSSAQLDFISSNKPKSGSARIFSNLSDIAKFFSHSPQRVAVLDEIVGQRIPRSSATRWNF